MDRTANAETSALMREPSPRVTGASSPAASAIAAGWTAVAPGYAPASDRGDGESRGRRSGPYASARTAVDYGLAVVLLVTTFPVLVLAVLVVRLTSRGPAIYRQTRVGRNGRTYTIFKIRSMRQDCERSSGPQWATRNDSRVTPFGRFLRRTHVDELSQLWNVLRGEMSLVGPRPERPEFVARLEQVIPRYRDRERVLPGVTGLAQVQFPPDTDLESVRRKLACDLHYIEHASLWLELRIVVCTGMKVFGLPCERSCRFLGLPTGLGLVAGVEPPVVVAAAGSVERAETPEPGHAACVEPARGWSPHAEPQHALV